MKTLPIALVVAAAFFALVGCTAPSGDVAVAADSELSTDACRAKALTAAETAYGNSPDGTHTTVLSKGKKYRVTVGINNPEDGPHDYYVTFATGCGSAPKVTEVPSLPHPLRDATHTAYTKIFSANGNDLPSSLSVAASALPASARKQLATWNNHGHSVCSAASGYKVSVSGKETYAVACTVPQDSIKIHVAIYDAAGGDIDQAAIYHTNSVGQNGVSWQNETFLQQD